MPHSEETTPARPLPLAAPIRVTQLRRASPTAFEITPDEGERADIAAFLGIPKVRKLRFSGEIAALHGGGWELTGELGATVVQECIVTLEPVTTRIDEGVERRYLPNLTAADDSAEVEMPEDVDVEPLGNVIDPAAVMVEALALALPPFPRAEGAELGEAVYTEPGREPMRDEDARPLAGLAELRDRMSRREPEE